MIFERQKYKLFSRKQLANRWGVPVGMTLLIFFILSLFSIPNAVKILTSEEGINLLTYDYGNVYNYFEAYSTAVSNHTSFLPTLVQTLVEAILIIASLNVYLKMSRSPNKVSFSTFIEGFNNWYRAIFCELFRGIFVFLWSLLFFIPGIIKSYSYSQMGFLIAEFPKLSIPKAMTISKIITKGNKWNIFVMQLSFLGWDILSVFTLEILQLWLKPYKTMSFVNAYHAMLKDSLEKGIITSEDLK